ncbi:cupin domain-containing protein (plasmid) [Rhodobacteraceae bacterium SC52]|uniref:Cupin domain-containing protein n=2 Tax=Meridianimarinicoccus aquatilis TaxID=2552766 RepID=A0A4R6AN86_9RHOB|nr:cupin domain-containing protein [Rhodobacteraceae bacterium SC52]TDL85197.1 cupin domain-containing protein [Fluviibacterium aquatile]
MDRDFRIFSTHVDTSDLRPLLMRLLPDQGSIEVQRDVEGKEHAWHRHATDETLVVLEGSVRFYWDQGEKICGPGTVISLPAGMLHGSVALEGGAVYLIAFHSVNLPQHG